MSYGYENDYCTLWSVNDCYTSYGRPYGHSDTGRCSLYQVGAISRLMLVSSRLSRCPSVNGAAAGKRDAWPHARGLCWTFCSRTRRTQQIHMRTTVAMLMLLAAARATSHGPVCDILDPIISAMPGEICACEDAPSGVGGNAVCTMMVPSDQPIELVAETLFGPAVIINPITFAVGTKVLPCGDPASVAVHGERVPSNRCGRTPAHMYQPRPQSDVPNVVAQLLLPFPVGTSMQPPSYRS